MTAWPAAARPAGVAAPDARAGAAASGGEASVILLRVRDSTSWGSRRRGDATAAAAVMVEGRRVGRKGRRAARAATPLAGCPHLRWARSSGGDASQTGGRVREPAQGGEVQEWQTL